MWQGTVHKNLTYGEELKVYEDAGSEDLQNLTALAEYLEGEEK